MNVLQIPVMRMLIVQTALVDSLVRVMKDTDQLVENVKVRLYECIQDQYRSLSY